MFAVLLTVAGPAVALPMQPPQASRPAVAGGGAPLEFQQAPRLDYDIVYVRAPRRGDDRQIAWSDVSAPFRAEPGSDLVLLHPDGSEEVLVAAGNHATADPAVSLDGQWIYYVLFQNKSPAASGLLQPVSSDIYKVHVKMREVVRLTRQEFTPNTGVADPAVDPPGVFNLGPCPVPGGRVVFTSTRNGFVSSKNYKGFTAYESLVGRDYKTSQLFVMDEDGGRQEQIGYMNLNGALDPVLLADGRVLFASFESQGMRDPRSWSLFTLRPDGTHWAPLVSALQTYNGTQRHFATQRTDGKIVFEEYYFQQNHGFGALFEADPSAPAGEPFFGSAWTGDPRNAPYERDERLPFTPRGYRKLTPFAHVSNKPAARAVEGDAQSPYLGKVTHPSAAPDNRLLLVWSPGPVYGILGEGQHRFAPPAIDSGIYLMTGTAAVSRPDSLLQIRNDPRYNEKFPRAVVPYARIHGSEPAVANARIGGSGPPIPAGAPYGMLGSSSLYKRESYPRGRLIGNAVTAAYPGGDDPHEFLGGMVAAAGNWISQGADAGKYGNDEIHAIRVLAMEPTTDPALAGRTARRWWNLGNERYRILGEIPVRKFEDGKEPLDPDGNPDTSFLVKIPADVPWTLQTLDRNGMVLNMAQTWHMLRPGESRVDCGGCHAHSQRPTPFEATVAARADYKVFDLTVNATLLTDRAHDESGVSWDADHATGTRRVSGAPTVEYFRDVQPIFAKHCVACHTKSWKEPAGNLVLDDDDTLVEVPAGAWLDLFLDKPPTRLPGTYMRLAADAMGRFGHPSGLSTKVSSSLWGYLQGSRYVRAMQSRRSLLAWKIHGRRLDGFRNEDFLHFTRPGDLGSLVWQGKPFEPDGELIRVERGRLDLAYLGSEMPPRKAIEGNYRTPDGQTVRVPPLTDEDRRTIVRWIDLGCPIDLAGSRRDRKEGSFASNGGWFDDENRPTVAIAFEETSGDDARLTIAIGVYDVGSGLDQSALDIQASFKVNGREPGSNLLPLCVWDAGRYLLHVPRDAAAQGSGEAAPRIRVSARDRSGNVTLRERTLPRLR